MEVDKNENGTLELTETENELYDRQIRLWGLDSQKRLRTAKVFISGMNGLGAEVTKNLILSGVHSVKLHDDQIVTEEDYCSQFLVPRSTLGSNRASASIERATQLNSLVEISSDTEPLASKTADYFGQFDVVIITGAPDNELERIDGICRELKVKFFAGDVWGMFGYSFADLQKHTFVEDCVKHKIVSKPNENIKTQMVTTTVQRELNFPSYTDVLAFDINTTAFQKKLKRTGPSFVMLRILQQFRKNFKRNPSYKSRDTDIQELEKLRNEISGELGNIADFFPYVFGQISSTTAIVGGVLAQEVIKVISKKEAPHCNVFLFDPLSCCGFVEAIGVQ